MTLTIYDSSPPRFSLEVVISVPRIVDSAVSLHEIYEVQSVIETLPPSRGPAAYGGPTSHAADEVLPVSVENDVSPSVEPSAPPAKASIPEMLAASDTSKADDQALAVAETSLPASGGLMNSPAANAAVSDSVTSNSLENGYITLDAAAAAVRYGTTPAPNTGFQAAQDAEVDRGIWMTDVLSITRNTADSTKGNGKAAPSSENLVVEAASRPAAVILQPAGTMSAEEGGGIELAIAAPPAAASGDSPSGGESAAGNAAQQLSEIRPESGVGLFCDIEVAVAPTMPIGGSASTAAAYLDTGFLVAGMGIHGWKAGTAMKTMPPLIKSSRSSLAALADHLPLLLGVSVLVSGGGLRLEEKVSERERRLWNIEPLRQS